MPLPYPLFDWTSTRGLHLVTLRLPSEEDLQALVADQRDSTLPLPHNAPPPSPSRQQVAHARYLTRDTQDRASARVGAKRRTWQDWELGISDMPGVLFHYYLIVTGLQHLLQNEVSAYAQSTQGD